MEAGCSVGHTSVLPPAFELLRRDALQPLRWTVTHLDASVLRWVPETHKGPHKSVGMPGPSADAVFASHLGMKEQAGIHYGDRLQSSAPFWKGRGDLKRSAVQAAGPSNTYLRIRIQLCELFRYEIDQTSRS